MFTIFVSASSDLKPLRDLIHNALSKAGVNSITQDHTLGPSPRDVRDLLAKDIEFSDIIIHIAGDEYGAEALSQGQAPFPEAPTFRCSWTQFEYYYAHRLNKDVFAFVMAPGKRPIENQDELDRAKHELQKAHRQRIVSGKFDGTPVSSVTRTLNDSNEVTSNIDMLGRLAGIVRRGQQDWGGRKDLILAQLDQQTRELERIRQLSEENSEILRRVDQATTLDLNRSRRQRHLLIAALVAVLSPILVITLGGGMVEYGCRLSWLQEICLNNNWGNVATYRRAQTEENLAREFLKPATKDSFSVDARGSYDGFYVDVISNAPSTEDGTYLLQVGKDQPIQLTEAVSLKLENLARVAVVRKDANGSLVEIADLSNDVKTSLITNTKQTWSTRVGLPDACTVAGCRFKEHQSDRMICSPLVSSVELFQGDGEPHPIDRTNCSKLPSADHFGQSICVDFRNVPFDVKYDTPIELRYTFLDGQTFSQTKAIWATEDAHKSIDGKQLALWTEATPLPERSPGETPPALFVEFNPDLGWTLIVGISTCLSEPEPSLSDGRWLIDSDGKGLIPVGEYDSLRFGPPMTSDTPWIAASSELGRAISSGKAGVTVARDNGLGARLGPFSYVFDPRDSVLAAAKSRRDNFPGGVPPIWCVTPYGEAAFCRPKEVFDWMYVQKVEFGVNPAELEAIASLDISVSDFVTSECSRDYPTPCKEFNYTVPQGVRDVYYRVTFKDGKSSEVTRVTL